MASTGKGMILHYSRKGVPLGHPFTEQNVEKCENFKFRESDVLIVGYPKSGNTWLQEMTWLVLNDANTEGAKNSSIMSRAPLMESIFPGQPAFVDKLEEIPGPRLMNTHLPNVFLKDGLEKGRPKVIVVMRNPKDLVVSYFHFYNTRPGRCIPDFNDFFAKFMEGSLLFGSYFDFCSNWYHHQGDDNFLFLTYEAMKKDHHRTVRDIAKFLGRNLTDDQVERIVDFTSFKSMKDRPQAKVNKSEETDKSQKDKAKIGSGSFFRKGEVGDWKNTMSIDQSKQIDQRVKDVLEPVGLNFTFEL